MKKEWYVSWNLPDEPRQLIGPVIGSRSTARKIKALLPKINSEIQAEVLDKKESETGCSTGSRVFLTDIDATLTRMIVGILAAINQDRSLTGVGRIEMRRLKANQQEVQAILRSIA